MTNILQTRQVFDRTHFDKLSSMVGSALTSDLVQQVYALKALLDDPIMRSSYRDMAAYTDYVFRTAAGQAKNNRDVVQLALKAIHAIGVGAEIRSYGALSSVEEVPGRFSPARGGIQ